MDDCIEKNITDIRKEIIKYNLSQEVRLIAVSKTKPIEDITLAIKAGQMEFGENKVQEAFEKWDELKKKNPELILHLIGPLQTNKVRKAIHLFDVIQTLDRPKLAEAIGRIMREEGKKPQLYIQVNIGLEPQKSGILPTDLDDFYQYCTKDMELNIVGLMAIPPYGEDASPYFKQMKALQKQLNLPYLSMGMSDDYKIAIKEGATHIRVGSSIFGQRLTSKK